MFEIIAAKISSKKIPATPGNFSNLDIKIGFVMSKNLNKIIPKIIDIGVIDIPKKVIKVPTTSSKTISLGSGFLKYKILFSTIRIDKIMVTVVIKI